jgi:hypothetical protein
MPGKLFLLFTILTFSSLVAKPLHAEPVTEFRSGESQTHLLELFSSEGCSSCPPADAWLASLRSNPGLWKTFVPIEFHVDYWNRLGWSDPLSKSIFTDRQQTYAKEWSRSSVYTPGFVLDGEEWRRSGDRGPLSDVSKNRVGVLSARKIGKYTFSVTFTPTQGRTSARVYAALLGNGLESKVSSGENAGSLLKHEFAVLTLTQKEMESEKSHLTAVIELKPPSGKPAKSYSVALWVTDGQSQKPIQIVGGDL